MLGDVAIVLDGGRVAQYGDPENVFRRPASAYIADFLGAENVFAGVAERLEGQGVSFRTGELTFYAVDDAAAGEPGSASVHAVIRAEEVSLAATHATTLEGAVLPVQVLGSGPFLNAAVDNAIARAAKLFAMTVDEVKNRSTISGAVDIGRLPGFVQLSLLVPRDRLERIGIDHVVEAQYGEPAGW